MRYWMVGLITALMVSDYLLTIAANRLRIRSGYDQRLIIDHYELNPDLQDAVASLRWINPRHLLRSSGVCAILLIIVFLSNARPGEHQWPAELLLGSLLTLFAMLNARHLMNLLTFRYVQSNPGSVSGSLQVSHRFALYQSITLNLLTFIPLMVITIFEPAPLLIGSLLAAVYALVSHRKWIMGENKSPSIMDSGSQSR